MNRGRRGEDIFHDKDGCQMFADLLKQPINIAVYPARIIRLDCLIEIGNAFHVDKYSSTGGIIGRLKQRMKTDKKLGKRVLTLLENIRKSQGQTCPTGVMFFQQ